MSTQNKKQRLTLCLAVGYQIEVQALFSDRFVSMFDGWEVTVNPERGSTTLSGGVADQAALHGWLARIRDLGLPLISVMRVEPDY